MIGPENIDAALDRQQADAEAQAAIETEADAMTFDLLRAEKMVLGFLMGQDAAASVRACNLIPEHFANPLHRRVAEEVFARAKSGYWGEALIQDVLGGGEFVLEDMLEKCGGVAYLREAIRLSTMAGASFAVASEHVLNAWKAKRLIEIATNIEDIAERVVGTAFDYMSPRRADQGELARTFVVHLLDAAAQAMELAGSARTL